jgi:hypothetical protein
LVREIYVRKQREQKRLNHQLLILRGFIKLPNAGSPTRIALTRTVGTGWKGSEQHLEEVVFAAYDRNSDWSDEEILEKLLALNLERRR